MHREVTALQILGWVSHSCKYYIQNFISKKKKLNEIRFSNKILSHFLQVIQYLLVFQGFICRTKKQVKINYYTHSKSITLSKGNCMLSLPYIYYFLYFNTKGTFMSSLEFWGWLQPINHILTHPLLSNILHTVSFIVTHTWREVIWTDRDTNLNL